MLINVSTTTPLQAALLVLIAAYVVGQPPRLDAEQRDLVGGYLNTAGKVDPRDAELAAQHLYSVGGPRILVPYVA